MFYVVPDALLGHKDTAQGTQSPPLGAFLAFWYVLWHKGAYVFSYMLTRKKCELFPFYFDKIFL